MSIISRASAGVALMGMLLWVGAAHATTAAQKCQEQKLKAQGKLQLCLKKNSAKVLGGKLDASATCQLKFSAALTKADTTAGTPCPYLDNGDGTLSDLNTGLMWEKKDNLDFVVDDADAHDADNYYHWSASGTAPDGPVFTDFLAKLNNGASTDGGAGTAITGCFAGHCDWRLPTILEAQGIVDATQGVCGSGSGACIDPAFGPTQASSYWSATTYSALPTQAWASGFFGEGFAVGYGGKVGDDVYVRAVRSGW